jgi:hypothetical protein
MRGSFKLALTLAIPLPNYRRSGDQGRRARRFTQRLAEYPLVNAPKTEFV